MKAQEESTSAGAINVGSRKSQLALIQTQIATQKLREYFANNPDDLDQSSRPLEFNVVAMNTIGDEILNKPLPAIGTKSLFTRDLEVALIENKIDFVVHSLKDLPTTLPDGCTIGAILKRDDPEDVIILNKSLRNEIDPLCLLSPDTSWGKEMKIGTSSQRRIAMIRMLNPRINCIDIRGNLNTRLSKLDDDKSDYAAIILAKAGLNRMGWNNLSGCKLSPDTATSLENWHYAVGQGAIAVECRSNDDRILKLLSKVVDLRTTFEAIAERSLMKELDGGCSVPLGTRSSWTREGDLDVLKLDGVVLSLDGTKMLKASDSVRIKITPGSLNGPVGELKVETFETGISLIMPEGSCTREHAKNCSRLGSEVARKLIESGCQELIESARINSG